MGSLEDEILRYVYKQREKHGIFAVTLNDICDNFRFLSNNGIEPAIKVRKGTSLHARGCYARKVVVVAAAIKQSADFKSWRDSAGYYGSRWIVESVFSCMKRTFGEYVRAKKFRNMVKGDGYQDHSI